MDLTNDQQQQLANLGVILCYAHGSVVRGTTMRESDLDIAVLLAQAPQPADALRVMEQVRAILQPLAPTRELDIAFLNDSSPLFQQVVAVEGTVLYERSEDDRIRLEFRAMHEYEASRRIHRIAFQAIMARPAPL